MLVTIVRHAAWPMIGVLPLWLLSGSGLLRDGSEGYEFILLFVAALFVVAASIVTATLARRLRGSHTSASFAFAGLTIAWWAVVALVPFFMFELGDTVTNPSFAQHIGLSRTANDGALGLLVWGAIVLAVASWIALGVARSQLNRRAWGRERVG
jgi:hypothetical protein